ncbi:MAG: EAL domain-containing protein [Gammaproteobacteria bacterium]|nr:EAL domain-containing protein [Gammaproteobacteria bacterium]
MIIDYPLERKHIHFNPVEVRIAFKPPRNSLHNARLIQAIDNQLKLMKNNPNSSFHTATNRWLGLIETTELPKWVIPAMWAALGVILLLLLGNFILRNRIKHHTKALRDSQELFSAFMKHLPGMAMVKGEDDRFLYVNPTWSEVVGASAKKAIGKTTADIFPATLTNTIHQQDHEIRSSNQPKVYKERVGSDKTDRLWQVTKFPIPNIHQQKNLIGGIGLDITEHEATKQMLRSLIRRNQLILDSAGEGILGLDAKGLCTFINRAALDMLEYSQDELIGQNLHPIIHHSHEDKSPFPEEDCPIYQVLHKNQITRVAEDIFWTKSDAALPVAYTATPISEQPHAGLVVVFRDITQSRIDSRKMDYLATHDTLTGLLNRRAFEETLVDTIEQTKKSGESHILAYIDMDRFKPINDTCGHAAGDMLLKKISAILQSGLRQEDTIGRIGGDEFAILLGHCTMNDAIQILDTLRKRIESYNFAWEDKTFSVGFSAGTVVINQNCSDKKALLNAADTACYIAKEGGRGHTHIYQPDDASMERRKGISQWVPLLTRALKGDGFLLDYQEIQATSGEGLGCELLVRFRGPNAKTILPGAFIPAAERYGLMPQLDQWVIRKAFHTLSQSHILKQFDFCTINLSGASLSDPDCLPFMNTLMDEHPGLSRRICFEITESNAITNLGLARQLMSQMKERGCRFALDGFGGGISSFSHLNQLPVDFLKIDSHFITGIASNDVSQTIISTINEIGHRLDLKIIAPHVEDDLSLKILKDLGVDYVQGYGIAKPKSIGDE